MVSPAPGVAEMVTVPVPHLEPPVPVGAAGTAFTVTDEVVLLQLVVPSVKVKVTLPAATPVITPALVTVAIATLLLVQVPPDVGDKVAVLPTQTDAGAVTTGKAFTVTEEVVLLQLVVPSVKVKVTLPAPTPVITPALVTVATEVLLLVQVPPEVGDNVAVPPTHKAEGAVTTGKELTMTEEVVLLQLVVPSVKVKVTLPAPTPVITPALVTVATEVLLLVQVPPDVGDNVAVLPTHKAEGAVAAGKAFTVTVEVVLLQLVTPSVKVKVTVPAATPVITPTLVTVAIALSLLTQVPPVVGDNVAVLPTQTEAGAVTTGGAFTVMIELHDTVLPQSSVVVQVTVWAPTPNTAPFSDVPVLGLTPASVE